ncbi:FKBP-type peptidyl-prolyl cis-trans isomerase [Nitrospira sp. BLG_2]|uniref:FKBP-type peptidyl-prolyl cis-trans isomerase n=1 Tax=Nitrospira sp. BLG_2 TaxID=3397507 RepID=UPI003B9D5E19
MRRPYLLFSLSAWSAVLLFSTVAACAGDQKKETTPMTVSNGKQVTLEYTLKLDDQSVVDTNVGGEPLKVTQGGHQIIPGVEKALDGMAVGEKKKFTVAPADGYGTVDPKAFQEVDKNLVPADSRKVGTQLEGKTADGQKVFPRISEVKNETIVLDFNHPLAGKTLYFDVKVLDVAQASLK